MPKTICCRGGVLQLSPNWGGDKVVGELQRWIDIKCPTMLQLMLMSCIMWSGTMHLQILNSLQEKHCCSAYHKKQKRSGP